MDSKDSFNKLGCTPVHLVPSTPSKDSSLSTQTIFAPSYLANTKRKRKTRYRNEWQQVQEIVNTRFIRGRRPMTNQEHGIPAQFGGKRTSITYPDPKVTNIIIQSQPPNKKPKNKTMSWTVWSVYFVDYEYGVSTLNPQPPPKKKEKNHFVDTGVPSFPDPHHLLVWFT